MPPLMSHLQSLLSPAVYSQQRHYRQLGMRERILTLPLMVAAVVTLLWRQVPSVGELTRMLNRDDLLWAKAVRVSRQSVSERFLSFPYRLFEQVFRDLMPTLTIDGHSESDRFRPVSSTRGSTLSRFGPPMAQSLKPCFVNSRVCKIVRRVSWRAKSARLSNWAVSCR